MPRLYRNISSNMTAWPSGFRSSVRDGRCRHAKAQMPVPLSVPALSGPACSRRFRRRFLCWRRKSTGRPPNVGVGELLPRGVRGRSPRCVPPSPSAECHRLKACLGNDIWPSGGNNWTRQRRRRAAQQDQDEGSENESHLHNGHYLFHQHGPWASIGATLRASPIASRTPRPRGRSCRRRESIASRLGSRID